jgi:hypothetical protein
MEFDREAAGKLLALLAPRRKNEKQKKTAKAKAGAAQAAGATSRAIRNAVRERCAQLNNACCEACMTPLHGLGEWDHWLGGTGRRKPRESVATTWLLCRACHEARTESLPSAAFWNQRFGRHCERYGYPFSPHIEHAQLPGRAAR